MRQKRKAQGGTGAVGAGGKAKQRKRDSAAGGQARPRQPASDAGEAGVHAAPDVGQQPSRTAAEAEAQPQPTVLTARSGRARQQQGGSNGELVAARGGGEGDADAPAGRDARKKKGSWAHRAKPLVLCARGITFRYRHLMTDLAQLVPHHKTDSKLDLRHDWNAINEVAELKAATHVAFFEARKRQDLYLWLAKVPSGPSVRFYGSNVHTMQELKLSGNHLKGSRPVLAFDPDFDTQPQLQVIKELLLQLFVTPTGHQKSKPFFDHVVSFAWCDNRVWIRNYQVVASYDRKKLRETGPTLVEVGPRVTLQPIKVFAGSFKGKVLFENPAFVSPNAVRTYERKVAAGAYERRTQKTKQRESYKQANKFKTEQLVDPDLFRLPDGEQDLKEELDIDLLSDDDM